MLAVFAPAADVEQEIEAVSRASLAAVNGTHAVISGPEAAVREAEERFTSRNLRTKVLTTSHAFHSALMDPALEPFRAVADQIACEPGRIPLICNVSGQPLSAGRKLDGDYWSQHIRAAVRFADGVEALQELGCEILLELGPQSVLTRMAAAEWRKPADQLISCLEQGSDDAESLAKAMGRLHVHGVTPDFEAYHDGKACRRVVLPTYPFQRRRFWGPDKPGAFHADYHTAHPLLGAKVSLAGLADETRYESFVEPDSPSWLPDHEVMGQVVMPGAAFNEIALAAARNARVENAVFEQPLRPTGRTAVQTVVRQGETGRQTIEIYSSPAGDSQWVRHFTADLVKIAGSAPAPADRGEAEASCSDAVEPQSFYARMLELGLKYGESFQTIESLRYSTSEVAARLRTRGDVRGFAIPPTLLDGTLHSLAVCLLKDDDDHLLLPVGIDAVTVYREAESDLWCRGVLTGSDDRNRTANVSLFTNDGHVVAVIEGLRVQQVSRAALRQLSGVGSERLLYETAWQPFRLPAATEESADWLAVSTAGHDSPLMPKLLEELKGRGQRVVELRLDRGAAFRQDSDGRITLGGDVRADWTKLFETLSAHSPFRPEGVVWLLADHRKGESAVSRNGASHGSQPADSEATRLLGEVDLHATALLHLIATLHERGQRDIRCGLELVTSDAVAVDEAANVDPRQSQYWGLGRVIGAEEGGFRCRLIDVLSSDLDQGETATSLTDF
ncbi:MAG: polyketide synthase dehydratase domain-containing protein, partial [Planctomycetota bacterium]